IDYALAGSSSVSDENNAKEIYINEANQDGFHIKQITKQGINELFTASFPINYATKTFSLSCEENSLIIQIDHTGLPYAGIEQLQLTADEKIIQPIYACFEDTGQNILTDLLCDDYNVAVAYQHPIEIAWDLTDQPTDTIYSLLIKANEYPKGSPLSWEGGTYKIGTNHRTCVIDGRLDDPTLTPLYSPVWRPDSGHPDGITNVYISEDEHYVYFSFDITCDNTNDIGEDWFELIIDDMVFHVDDYNTKYGKLGFGKTDAVSYDHQIAELFIPKHVIQTDEITFSTLYYGTAAVYSDGYSSDVDTGIQYITPLETEPEVIQEVVYTNEHAKSSLMIDSFTVTNTGDAHDAWLYTLWLWVDGGDGNYDGGEKDDILIGSHVYKPDLQSGEVIGDNDGFSCLEIPPRSSKRVFVTITIQPNSRPNVESLQTRLDARDLVKSSSVVWYSTPRTNEGLVTASSPTYIFSKAEYKTSAALDTNDNGIIDQIIVTTDYKIGPATQIWYGDDEESAIDGFTVKYDGNEIGIDGIEFYESNETEASFALILDEEHIFLPVDTSSNDFSVSYDYSQEELFIENDESHSVPVWPFADMPLNDNAGPVVTSLTVSDTMITGEDAEDTFEVTLSFSEPMNISSFPVLDFDAAVDDGSARILIFDSQYMVDENTYQINYTITENIYEGTVDVICTTEGVFDIQGIQMNSSYIESDLFTVDTKAPAISGFPTDSITPGEDYTVRVDVSDGSDIQNVLLDYHFGGSWNTKPMSYDPGNKEYIAVVTPPLDATNMTYKLSAYDIHDNGEETSIKELTVTSDESEDDDGVEQEKTDDSTPGFTTAFVFIAMAAMIIIFLIFIRRPRF
ncbi:MAG: hypothetical protein R6U21_01645, partial [Thermoplasmatota archaeon]